ncbi:tenascin-N-like [Diadema antillarum]|uniref:tenascin-N-like n=1 Tax=Diadema antillarum TaxID=105358 RepID=UPI003A884005
MLQLYNLDPATEYDVSIQAVAGDLVSEAVSRTLETSGLQSLEILVKESTINSITVVWGMVTNLESLQPLSRYQLSITPQDAQTQLRELDIFRATFSGLIPGREYTITLSVTLTDITPVSINQYTTPRPPAAFALSQAGFTQLNLAFGAPDFGYFDFFVLEYQQTTSCSGCLLPTSTRISMDERAYNVTELRPGSSYDFSLYVQAGDESSSVLQRTFETIPVPALEVVVTQTTCDQITIFWAPYSSAENIFYDINIQPEPPIQLPVYRVDTDNTFTQLMAATEYVISVRAIGGDLASPVEYQDVTQKTRPNGAGNIAIVETTATSIEFSWEPAASQVDAYRITVREEGGVETLLATRSSTEERRYKLSELDPSTAYTISVITVNDLDTPQELEGCDVQNITVNTDTISVGEIVVTAFTTNSIAVIYGESENADVTGYQLQIRSSASSAVLQTRTLTPAQSPRVTFSGLVSGANYVITLTILGLDPATSESSIMQRTRPVAPSAVQALLPMVTSLTITWSRPTGIYENFLVVVSNSDGTMQGNITLGDEQFQLEVVNLLPGTSYGIEVFSSVGTGDDLILSVPQTATGTTASLGPLEVISIGRTSETLRVAWGASTRDDPGRYLVFFNLPGSTDSNPRLVEDRDTTRGNLIPGQLYQVVVQLENYPSDTGSLDIRTIPSPVQNLRVDGEPTLVSLGVIWEKPVGSMFDGYAVYITGPDNVQTLVARIADVDNTRYQIENLNPDTVYSVGVHTVSGLNESTEVASERSTTQVSTASLDPLVLEAFSVTETSIGIAFGRATDATLGSASAYVLSLTSGSTVISTNLPVGGATKNIFMNLVPGTLYQARLGILGTQTTSDILSIRTIPRQVTNLRDTQRTTTSIQLAWMPATGNVDSYLLTYRYTDPLSGPMNMNVPIESDQDSVTLPDLMPATEYSINFVTVAGSGDNAEQSEGIELTLSTRSADLTYEYNAQARTVTLQWDAETGPVQGYLILYNSSNDDQVTMVQTGSPGPIVLQGLEPGNQYYFQLRTITSPTANFLSSDLTFVTAPLPPQDMAVTEPSRSTITITWSPPAEGQYFGYVLEYAGTGLTPEIGRTPARSELPRHQRSMTLKGLTPAVSYAISLTSFVEYDGMQTESIMSTVQGTTDRTTSLDIVANFVNQTSIRISWQPTVGAQSYRTRVTDAVTGLNLQEVVFIDDVNSLERHGLVPGRPYIFYVEAEAVRINDTLTQRTVPMAPTDITISADAVSLTLEWEPVGGDVSGYFVTFQESSDLTQISDPVTITDTSDPMSQPHCS